MNKGVNPGEAWWVHNWIYGGKLGSTPLIDNLKNRPLWIRFFAVLMGLGWFIVGMVGYIWMWYLVVTDFEIVYLIVFVPLSFLPLIVIGAGLRVIQANFLGHKKIKK